MRLGFHGQPVFSLGFRLVVMNSSSVDEQSRKTGLAGPGGQSQLSEGFTTLGLSTTCLYALATRKLVRRLATTGLSPQLRDKGHFM